MVERINFEEVEDYLQDMRRMVAKLQHGGVVSVDDYEAFFDQGLGLIGCMYHRDDEPVVMSSLNSYLRRDAGLCVGRTTRITELADLRKLVESQWKAHEGCVSRGANMSPDLVDQYFDDRATLVYVE